MAGLPFEEFWRRTPREAELMLEVALERARAAQDVARAVAHETARLVAFAMHAPRKMPEFRSAGRPARAAAPGRAAGGGGEADDARVRAYLIGLALRGQPPEQHRE